MAFVSGLEVKYGRILVLVCLCVGLIILYRNSTKRIETAQITPNPKSSPSRSSRIGAGDIENKDSIVTDDDKKSSQKDELVVLQLQLQKVEIDLDGNKCIIEYIEVNSQLTNARKPVILLLHGKNYNATTWNTGTGTMAKLENWGYRAVAVNLHDNGTEACTNHLREEKSTVMHLLVKTLKLVKVIVISPSLSGTFSIPYITSDLYTDEIAGYVAVAPVIHSDYKEESFKQLSKLKALIVYGANDLSAGSSIHLLKQMPLSHQVVLADAGHVCYVDQPGKWHEELKKFLDTF